MQERKSLGELVREKREGMRLQQGQLAKRLRVSQPTISQWERGETVPTGRNLIRVCAFLGLDVRELL